MDIFKMLEFGLGAWGIAEQNRFDEEARQLGIERYDEAEALSLGLRGRVLPNIKRLGREQMQMLEGSGVQQKKDVSRRAQTRLAGVQSNLQRRGLGNTTVPGSMAKGFGEYEEDQLARIDEQVRQERMQTHGYWGLLGETMDVDLTGQQINIKGGYQIPPQQSPLLAYSELSGRMVSPPEAPEPPGTDWGATLIDAGVKVGTGFAMGSDPAIKTGILGVDHSDILKRVEQLEVKEWEYKPGVTGPQGRHLGPMADQFAELFGLGEDHKTINMVDALGVCLSAIKALSARVRELEGK